MVRTKGEPGTGNVVEAVRHQRMIMGKVRELKGKDDDGAGSIAGSQDRGAHLPGEGGRRTAAPAGHQLRRWRHRHPGRRCADDAARVPTACSSDLAYSNPTTRPRWAKAIVEAVTHFDDPKVIAEVSKGLGEAMQGIEISTITRGTADAGARLVSPNHETSYFPFYPNEPVHLMNFSSMI